MEPAFEPALDEEAAELEAAPELDADELDAEAIEAEDIQVADEAPEPALDEEAVELEPSIELDAEDIDETDEALEPAHRIFDLHILTRDTRETLSYCERLCEEKLDPARACDDQLVFVRQLIDTENRDDFLQIVVSLQNLLDLLRNVIMLVTDHTRIEDA